MVYNLDKLRTVVSAEFTDATIDSLRWADEKTLLASMRHVGAGRGRPYPRSLLVIDPESGEVQAFSRLAARGIDLVRVYPRWTLPDRLVSVLPGSTTRLLLNTGRLWQVDLATKEFSFASNPPPLTSPRSWVTDASGEARVLVSRLGYEQAVFARGPADDGWHEADRAPQDAAPVFVPLVVDEFDRDIVYVVSDHVDQQLGLYRWRTSTRDFVGGPVTPSRLRLHDVVFNPQHTEIYGTRYVSKERSLIWLRPEYDAVIERIRSAVPNLNVRVVSVSDRLQRVLIAAKNSENPEEFYIYKRDDGSLTPIGPVFSGSANQAMPEIQEVLIPFANDQTIHAYLSHSPIGSDGNNVPGPVVVLAHGGPYSHDFFESDALVRYMIDLGYTVMQVSDRDRFLYPRPLEHFEWAPSAPGRLVAATRWLVQQGIADPDHICIVGRVYGGYSALMAAADAPDLFACVVDLNGPTNLRGLSDRYWLIDEVPEAHSSPVNRAEDIKSPVLLIGGENNGLFNSTQQYRLLRRRLVANGVPVQYVSLEDVDHELTAVAAREEFARVLSDFLRGWLD